MGNIGFFELLVILIIILILFGPGKLPQIGEALGKAVGNFKRAMQQAEEDTNKDKSPALTASNEKEKDVEKTLKG